MTSRLLSQVKGFNKDSLKSVETQITTPDGKQFVERRDNSGTSSVEQREAKVLGFCPDLQPDLSVGRALEWLLVGSQDVAQDMGTLRQLGVTHILNVAFGISNAFPNDFTYLTVPMYDDPTQEFTAHYSQCRHFIEQAHAAGGTVLIHCNAGVSRSATMALAYMMEAEKISLECAYDQLKLSRPAVQPNPGFMSQLAEFQEQLGILN